MHNCSLFILGAGELGQSGRGVHQVGRRLQIAPVIRYDPRNVGYRTGNVGDDALHVVQVLFCRRGDRFHVLHRLCQRLQRRQELCQNDDQDDDSHDRHHK